MIDPNEKIKLVELSAYNTEWPVMFTCEAAKITAILKDNCLAVHHIGSTAIPGIHAKPIIDILPVVKDITLIDALNPQFEALGYVCMGEYGIPGRRFYWKSKTHRSHHIHLFEQGSSEILRHVAFKDFMLAHAEYAQAYSLIKQHLAKVFTHDIENYVDGKASFVQFIDYKTQTARDSQLKAEDSIIIKPYNAAWPLLAQAEINVIKKSTEQLPHVAIEHLGSTAVPALSSKPIIDIFIVLDSIQQAEQWIHPLETLGYVFWPQNPDKTHLRFFKGMPPFGMQRTHHVHIVDKSNNTFEHRILFRDILRKNETIKLQYEALKIQLAKSYLTDREAYTDMKSEFIEKVLHAQGYSKPILR